MLSADTLQSSKDDNLSPYELERLKNIKFVQEELGGTCTNLNYSVDNLAKSNRKRKLEEYKPTKKTIKHQVEYVRRSARIRQEKSSSGNEEESNSVNDDNQKGNLKKVLCEGSIIVKFPWCHVKRDKKGDDEFYSALNDDDFLNDDEIDYYEDRRKRPRSSFKPPVQVSVANITPEMLENVCYFSSEKQYCPNGGGTTCHQCRQKTLDQKTYCRHKECRGARGMFCGFCLGKRYGEDVAVALLEKKWACPVCRNCCNCSICRTKRGKAPTGQLYRIAKDAGFSSVREYLKHEEGENPTQISDEDYKEDEKENISGVKKHNDDSDVLSIDSGQSRSDSNLLSGWENSNDDVYFKDYIKLDVAVK